MTACVRTRINSSKGHSNNRVIKTGEYTDISENSNNKIVFNGNDNTVVFQYFDSFFNSKNSRSVLIIEGSGNKIMIDNYKVIDNSINNCDTIILKGDDTYADILNAYFVDQSENSSGTYKYNISHYSEKAEVYDSSQIYNKVNGRWMYISEVHDYYLKEIAQGNTKAAFYIGELIKVGIGIEPDCKLAEHYFLIASRNGLPDAMCALGELYEKGCNNINQDIDEAIKWYKKASKLGNSYATERLEVLLNIR